MAALAVRSAFAEGQAIPREFTCDGDGRSPPLSIDGLPDTAAYLAVILDDPDAPRGTWTHWTFWDLPVAHRRLAAGADVAELGALQGLTSARSIGYHGPCPPSGTHRYIVRAFATAEPLGLPFGAAVQDLKAALRGRSLAEGTLTGTYKRT